MRFILRLFVIVAFATMVTPRAFAQKQATGPNEAVVTSTSDANSSLEQHPAGPAPTPEHTGIKALFSDLYDDVKHLPSKENLIWAGVGGAAALAVHPADNRINEELTDASWSHPFFAFGATLGESYTLGAISATVYAVGRVKHLPKVSHTGMDMIQSLIVAEGITMSLKYTVQRERPDGSGANSFPSGHSADTFAIATALERHFGWKGAVPAYLFASYVAMSRLHDNVHYASDVAFGSAVGIIAGRTVTRHGRPFPVALVSVPGGAAVMYTKQVE